jgi:hypothetical protein
VTAKRAKVVPGAAYLLGGERITIVTVTRRRAGTLPGRPVKPGLPVRLAPFNVAMRLGDGTVTVRAFRGLRKVNGQTGKAGT